ncbi:hypothetical protein Fmac_016645 [Flemingia macrophylla]|uniref:Uncharacterized protein n=1 Tax=Flemingia macrophylla TaxID=520843 RepID=A0ABD1MIP7_9FABA
MGGALGKDESPKMPETKIEAKMVEAMQWRESQGSSVKSFNTTILKFPKIDESLRKCKAIFEQFGRFQFKYMVLLNWYFHLIYSNKAFNCCK